MNKTTFTLILVALTAFSILLTGCQNLPGTHEQQGAVAGGAGGAVVGSAVSDSLLGTLLGGAAGAGAGYLLGANSDKILGNDSDGAQQAVQRARSDPATAADVRDSDTADLNGDGFVTLDEVVAMSDADLSDSDMLDRMRATDQVFELNAQQRDQLMDAGVSNTVVARMSSINQQQRDRLVNQRQEVISKDPDAAQ